MRKFKCPKCDATQEALAKQVSHPCPKNRNKFVDFEEVKEEETA